MARIADARSVADFLFDLKISRPVEARLLSPIQRILAAGQGMLSPVLENYYREPIRLVLLQQPTLTLETGFLDADFASGREVLHRSALLRGERTSRYYAHVSSLLLLDRLTTSARQLVLAGNLALSRILSETRTEFAMQVLSFSKQPAAYLAPIFLEPENSTIIVRTFQIVLLGEPAILVTEKFSLRSFENDSMTFDAGGRPVRKRAPRRGRHGARRKQPVRKNGNPPVV